MYLYQFLEDTKFTLYKTYSLHSCKKREYKISSFTLIEDSFSGFSLLYKKEIIYVIPQPHRTEKDNYYLNEFNHLKVLIREYKFKELLDGTS